MIEKKLLNGNTIPMIGLGVFKSEEGAEAENSIQWAVESGYRHIDTATLYKNEKSVGKAVRECGVKREDMFITTKVWTEEIRNGRTREAFYKSLESLGMDYVDLYLLHWPAEGRVQAWIELEKLRQEGLIKNIGVSNFNKIHIDELIEKTGVVPQANQVESNPRFQNTEIIEYCQSLGIAMQAWAPLGGGKTVAEMLGSQQLVSLSAKYNKSPAQIILRWNIQRDVISIPKSAKKARIAENIDVFDFALTAEDMALMKTMDTNIRQGGDPENFNF